MSSNKSEQPTPQKLRKLRDQGEMPKSTDLVGVGAFLCVALTLVGLGPRLIQQARTYLQASLVKIYDTDTFSPEVGLRDGLQAGTIMLVAILVAVFAGAFLANYIQVGFRITSKPLAPDLKRLNPVTNLKQKLSITMLYSLLKMLLFVIIFFWCAYIFSRSRLSLLTAYASSLDGPYGIVSFFGATLKSSLVFIVPLILLLASSDFLFQRYRFLKKNRMSKEEVMREFKESEGDPQQKSDRKRLHQEILEHQMLERVSTADCIIINPTHLAIAVKYDEDESDAPLVLAKGKRELAKRIREIARQSGVPVVRNVPLARALYDLEIDDAIPEELFETMAEVLRFVYEQYGSR